MLWGMEKALWVGDVSVIHAKSTVRTVLIEFFKLSYKALDITMEFPHNVWIG